MVKKAILREFSATRDANARPATISQKMHVPVRVSFLKEGISGPPYEVFRRE
jgi:hypothetical protein